MKHLTPTPSFCSRPATISLYWFTALPCPRRAEHLQKVRCIQAARPLRELEQTNSLSSLYNAKFRCTGAGSKIAIKLVGISSSGVRSAEQFLSAISTAAPALADTETHGLKAA